MSVKNRKICVKNTKNNVLNKLKKSVKNISVKNAKNLC